MQNTTVNQEEGYEKTAHYPVSISKRVDCFELRMC